MRELADLSAVLSLVEAHEAERGTPYRILIYSRLEFDWWLDHPPLRLLSPRRVWVPSGQNIGGLNDRHAVVPREFGPAYFRRWELLLSAQLLQAIPIEAMLHGSSEDFLDGALQHAGVKVGEFPNGAVLSCCSQGQRCYNGQTCFTMELSSDPEPILLDEIRAKARRAQQGTSSMEGGGILPAASPALFVRGKYRAEVHSLVLHLRWLMCSGARYAAWPASLVGRWGGHMQLAIVVPVGWRSIPQFALNRLIMLEHSAPFTRARRGGSGGGVAAGDTLDIFKELSLRASHGTRLPFLDAQLPRGMGRRGVCPLQNQSWKQVAPVRVPLGGFCAPTTDGSDCDRGNSGAWPFLDEHDCRSRCTSCARCNVISFSKINKDCSWYHDCHTGRELDELKQRGGCGWYQECAHGSEARRRGAQHLRAVLRNPSALREEGLLQLQAGWDYLTLKLK
uniref:Uncharacterized protein n=1 Tax=Haptolina ericina TaxID=156174 RepID=A0A7S3FK20_9EUKA